MKGDKNNGQRICDRVYLERLMDERCHIIDAQFALVRQRFDAADDALVHAEKVMDAKFHQVNNLREMVEENAKEYLRKDVYDAKTTRYDEWIEGVNRDITIMKTRSIIYTAALGLILVLVDIALRYAMVR